MKCTVNMDSLENSVMEMTGDNIELFIKDFNEAMHSLQEKYNVTVSMGPVTYVEEQFTAKLTVTNGLESEEVARHQFDANVWKYDHLGLLPGMYNRIFMGTDGQRYAIQGFRPNAKKWPIKMLRISDGEPRVCNESFIKEFLNEYYAEATVVS